MTPLRDPIAHFHANKHSPTTMLDGMETAHYELRKCLETQCQDMHDDGVSDLILWPHVAVNDLLVAAETDYLTERRFITDSNANEALAAQQAGYDQGYTEGYEDGSEDVEEEVAAQTEVEDETTIVTV